MDKWAKFIDHYKRHGTLARARDVAGITKDEFRRKLTENPDFLDEITEAEDVYHDLIRESFTTRGLHGYEEPVIYQGQLQYKKDEFGDYILDENLERIPLTVRKYSDTMAIALAKSKLPEFKDKENSQSVAVVINENNSAGFIDKFNIDELSVEDRKTMRNLLAKQIEHKSNN